MRFRLQPRKFYYGAFALALLTGAGSCAPFLARNGFTGGADAPRVRILLLATRSEFTIAAKSGLRVSGTDNDPVRNSIAFDPGDIRGTVTVEPVNSPLLLNGSPYRGHFVIVSSNNVVHVINIVRVDEYLSSVVPGEIPSGWDREALKAQTVAARTYTYYHIMNGRKENALYDLDATVNSQVYRGMADEKPSTTRAVLETAGEILIYDDRPILSYFHSTCGGKTSDDRYVWNNAPMPYLASVPCGFCNDSTKFRWESRLSLGEIRKYVAAQNGGVGAIRAVTFRRNNDRVTEVRIRHDRGSLTLTGNNFRLLFPPDKILSLYFKSTKVNNGLLLSGYGWGHGVGMCQWGARGMALRGYRYRDILMHYYRGVKLAGIRNGYLASKNKPAYSAQ